MNFSRQQRAAACFVVIDLLEECTEDESGKDCGREDGQGNG